MDENLIKILQDIEYRLNSDEYEAGPILTVGGASGLYSIGTPYNTECEYAVVSVNATAATGNAMISPNPGIAIPAIDGSVSYGQAGATDNNPIEGILVNASTNSSKQPPLFWQPLGRGRQLFIAVQSGASSSTLVSVAFRRKIARYIPKPPLRQPHTHSQPQSRRGNRTFMEGFEAQYPHEDYVHELIPESNDPATVGNVENAPSKAQVLLARMRDAQGKARR